MRVTYYLLAVTVWLDACHNSDSIRITDEVGLRARYGVQCRQLVLLGHQYDRGTLSDIDAQTTLLCAMDSGRTVHITVSGEGDPMHVYHACSVQLGPDVLDAPLDPSFIASALPPGTLQAGLERELYQLDLSQPTELASFPIDGVGVYVEWTPASPGVTFEAHLNGCLRTGTFPPISPHHPRPSRARKDDESEP